MKSILRILGSFFVTFLALICVFSLASIVAIGTPLLVFDINGDMVAFVSGILALASCVTAFVVAATLVVDYYEGGR